VFRSTAHRRDNNDAVPVPAVHERVVRASPVRAPMVVEQQKGRPVEWAKCLAAIGTELFDDLAIEFVLLCHSHSPFGGVPEWRVPADRTRGFRGAASPWKRLNVEVKKCRRKHPQ